MSAANRPIGVFDSGVGGLTVVRALSRLLPDEDIVYFGDTARVPYGTKSAKVVTAFALEDARFLIKQDVKMIVVACNTASAVALKRLQETFDIPVIGVIVPGARAGAAAAANGHVGIIGTPGTIASGVYPQEIARVNPGLTVSQAACPLFVPLAEEGWEDREAARLIAEEYLAPLRNDGISALVLGCTHYPMLKNILGLVMGPDTVLVDSAEATAAAVQELLAEKELAAENGSGHLTVFVSDVPHRFRDIGERFLGKTFTDLTRVDLEAIDLGGYQ